MDHARHMSSPSPTSSFLFQHSDRSFKSTILNPSLLSSATDLTNVDDYFSTSSTTATSPLSNLNGRVQNSFGDNNNDVDEDENDVILVSDDDNHQNQVTHHNSITNSSSSHPLSENNDIRHDRNHHTDQIDHCVIDQSSLNGVSGEAGGGGENDVDDVDSMHNMLSSSSTSSATTMPLLAETHHSHNPFSRMSLEEYSPLSLVDDCDNALTISPSSLTCGPHHPFKTSLNNLKMEGLDGVDVGVVDDDVTDAHSISPSLLSASVGTIPSHLWSNSSTAITQNPVLMSNSSTSFILSHHHHHHHHHHQLNSLMQQLEPQSLDEPPPLVANNSLELDNHQTPCHRPSSEPPPGSAFDSSSIGLGTNVEPKFTAASQSNASAMHLETPAVKTKRSSLGANNGKPKTAIDSIKTAQTSSSSSGSRSSRGNRNRSTSSSSQKQPNKSNQSNNKSASEHKSGKSNPLTLQAYPVSQHSSQVHLQLNHYQKLKELQQRLFGTVSEPEDKESKAECNINRESENSDRVGGSDANPEKDVEDSKKEGELGPPLEPTFEQVSMPTQNLGTQSNSATAITPTIHTNNYNRTRSRSSSRRRSKALKTDPGINSSSKKSSMSNKGNGGNQLQASRGSGQSKLVVTETAEPDTTTKTSDCIKLADLLSTTDSKDCKNAATNFGLVLNSAIAQEANNGTSNSNFCEPNNNGGNNNNNNNEKRIQHFQLQVSPTLTVVSNGSLMQPISMQHQPQLTADGAVVCSGVTTHDNQVLCRPVTVMTSMGPGLNATANGVQNIVSNNELLKGTAEATLIANWSNANQTSTNNGNGNVRANTANGTIATLTNGSGIGGHQIAIQVICQDGTSLVLPVSSSLNAVSLAPQSHQQLQQQSGSQSGSANQRNTGHILPLVSVANIIAQQQTASNDPSAATAGGSAGNQAQGGANNTGSQSGLAASSPTLAALLDAGSVRAGNCLSNDLNAHSNAQRIMSTNLLRKLIGNDTDTFELKPTSEKTTGSLVGGATCNSLRQQLNMTTSSKTATSAGAATAPTVTENGFSKQCKAASSTGNRQVDPAQPFRCEHCNSTFTRLGNFTRHKKIHTVPIKDGQRFKCDVCSKSFLQRCDLARHLHIHRGTEPHRCNICGKGYIRHSDLVTHQRFHNKEKPFGCPHCSKGFCQRGDLNRHLRSIHLQMKPILCPCCNRKFAKQETLLRHLNTAHRGRQGAPV